MISRRQSRSIAYRANLDHMQQTLRFLVRDSRADHPEICDLALAACSGGEGLQDWPGPAHDDRPYDYAAGSVGASDRVYGSTKDDIRLVMVRD